MSDEQPPGRDNEPDETPEEEAWFADPAGIPSPAVPSDPPPTVPSRSVQPGWAIAGFAAAFVVMPALAGLGVTLFGPYGALLGLVVPAAAASLLWNRGWRSFFIGMATAVVAAVVAGGICFAVVVTLVNTG